jgi:hypothetical protein
MAAATPTPTPIPTGVGCHRWRYALRWEQPSRLAILKNVLGDSVTTYTDFKAPGNGNQDDWPDPIAHSEIPDAWRYTLPSQPTTRLYDHDCGVGLPACALPTVTDLEGEQPGIYYSKGTWDWPRPGPRMVIYDPAYPPLYHPGSDTTGSRFYDDTAFPPAVTSPHPYPLDPVTGVPIPGTYDGFAWTLNYGYAAAPANDIIYGPDPGPPFLLMDETNDGSCGLGCGNSIPGQTGTPMSFPTSWTTRGGLVIGAETQDPKGVDPDVTLFNDPTLHPGLNQPSWTRNLHRDLVGNTATVVNWGLMTYSDASTDPDPANWCGDVASEYHLLVPVDSTDTGIVSAIEGYMRLKSATGPPLANPGLGANGGTSTKGAIAQADLALSATWSADPKKACNRAYGVILCTDGESNTCNLPAGGPWGAGCVPDTAGTDFTNFPPGAAEAMYLNAHQAPGGAIIRARTFAIGISSDISRCELNRTAYRGRTDASAPNTDAGFVLWDSDPSLIPLGGGGDDRLPHLDFPETAATTVPTNESGPSQPVSSGGFNRFGPDQAPPDDNDYAFFADDARALYNAFLAIVRGSASGDYTTSSPVSGAAVNLGNTVILTSARYPRWQGHIRALDTTNPLAIVDLWDAGVTLTNPSQPWHPNANGTAGHPARQLYTWDPATGALIAIVAGNAGTMNTLCGAPCVTTPITPSVIDFIRGLNPTTGLPRRWLLGPSINVTPAIVGPPQPYFQAGNVVNHKPFEATYTSRRKLTWIGADDGFLHALDLDDGTEVLGLLPPNLIANQLTLYKTFLDPSPQVSTATGQNAGFLFSEHTWGIASSLRFADVWFGAPTNAFKTVGFVTEGQGGNLVAAIDITHPYAGSLLRSPATPADQNYGAFAGANAGLPVDVLWTKNSVNYAGLFGGWSVPAVANDTFTTSKMTFGAGVNPTSLYPLGANTEKSANIFVVDPTTGTLLSTTAVTPLASPDTTTLVGLQTFTDSILFQTNASGFQNDNLADLSIQGDTNGRVNALFGGWASPTPSFFIDLNTAGGGPQPLYYSPAANGIGTLGLQVYALGSGSFYETSPTVSGWNVNRTAPPPVSSPPSPNDYPSTLPIFVPTLFMATNPYKITDVLFATVPLGQSGPPDLRPFVISKVVGGNGETRDDGTIALGIPLQTGPCPGPTCDPTYVAGVHTRLGIHSQVTSSPLLVGNVTSTTQDVFFTVFDPDWGCNGYSYIIKVEFTIDTTSHRPVFSATPTTVYAAGAGAASGFVVTEKGAFSAQSGVAKNEATLVKVDIPKPSLPGAPNFRPVWWREQK